VYARAGEGWAPRKVEVGLDNNRMIHLVSGVSEGDVIMMAPPVKDSKEPSLSAADAEELHKEHPPEPAEVKPAVPRKRRPRPLPEKEMPSALLRTYPCGRNVV
jgi:hypothetical protein